MGDRNDIRKRRLGGNYVPLRVDWAKRLESITAAIVLDRLIFGANLADDDGWFYFTVERMEDEAGVARKSYATARKVLESAGLIESDLRGVPPRIYIRINDDALDAWINGDEGTISNSPKGRIESSLGPNQIGRRAESSITETEIKKEKEREPPYPPKGVRLAEAFGLFWTAYPRKVSRAAAQKAFTKLDPDKPTLDRIVDDLTRRFTSGEWSIAPDRIQYIPHASTYLNQRRWEDEPPAAPVHQDRFGNKETSGSNDVQAILKRIREGDIS